MHADAQRDEKGVLYLLKLELQAVSELSDVGAGNETRILWKSNKRS